MKLIYLGLLLVLEISSITNKQIPNEMTDEMHANLRTEFRAFDQNDDNIITSDELTKLLDQQFDSYQIQILMDNADTNKDGIIDFKEYKNSI